jgi:N-acetylmuramoyl-L-alanine amidase/AmpD protein
MWAGIASSLAILSASPQATLDVPDPKTPFPTPWVQPGYLELVWIQSPNWNERPEGIVVDTIVLHSTVIETLEVTTRAFCRESSRVSAHFTIDKDGSIVQHVDTFKRAWHAGVSIDPDGRENVNHFSIGIELVNKNDGKDPYPAAQILALRGIIRSMRYRFPIKRVISHEWIARPIGRKSDPANFPWETLKDIPVEMVYGVPKNP